MARQNDRVWVRKDPRPGRRPERMCQVMNSFCLLSVYAVVLRHARERRRLRRERTRRVIPNRGADARAHRPRAPALLGLERQEPAAAL